MALMRLPNELLEKIILHSIPDAFEGLALTCKLLYELCTPFIAHHNEIRFYYQRFKYFKMKGLWQSHLYYIREPYACCSAYNLLARIGAEPRIARYMREADCNLDSQRAPRMDFTWYENDHRPEAVAQLMASSLYLKEAGLDWKEYYAAMEKEFDEFDASIYSQHAAAFLLTLLPNVKRLKLPASWQPVARTDKLVETIIRRARQAHLLRNAPSIAGVTRLEAEGRYEPTGRFSLDLLAPFLVLPHLRSFYSPRGVCMADGDERLVSRYMRDGLKSTLETVHFWRANISSRAIGELLKHTPHLKTLCYSRWTRATDEPQDWDLCQFIRTIQQTVGSHLVELCVNYRPFQGSILPGKVSMRGFPQLRQLELPLAVATCNQLAAAGEEHGEGYVESLLGDIVPASVSCLSLEGCETDDEQPALDSLFRNFAARKEAEVPALREVYIVEPYRKQSAYGRQYAKIAAEVEKSGVTFSYFRINNQWGGDREEE
ncbi:F-box domain protein [Aspergillus clavatus NRRL 1]|uniref:F-box domain protein n=1 Tax=Aspergillus clavatus (strain ATCC 1007 / CBS 513.65 / DSM 816 / NCTC 3887 / NRRL 1 / QM 1276 / 107) TaxID=344612 RepID=A1C8G9_ASPCL|nr:F-box domain protein [Aspergillus clavatus NRRL 1]EAW13606.1 F-box domain protein [Aspergillus clavatus NRRL 1]